MVDGAMAPRPSLPRSARQPGEPAAWQGNIALAAGKVINKKKAGKHFIVDITDDRLTWRRDE